MSRWFRMYDEVLDDPKVQRLSSDDFKAWINILCVASRNDGKIPPIADLSFALRLSANDARTLVERFLNGGLIDRRTGGADGWHYAPHGWDKRQYKSDTSTDRVKRFRKRTATVSVTAPETETETEDTLSKDNVAIVVPIDPEKRFWADAKTYLSGVSRNPGGLIGKWLKDHDRDAIKAAITRAQIEQAMEPIAFITGCLRQAKKAADDDDLYRFDGPC